MQVLVIINFRNNRRLSKLSLFLFYKKGYQRLVVRWFCNLWNFNFAPLGWKAFFSANEEDTQTVPDVRCICTFLPPTGGGRGADWIYFHSTHSDFRGTGCFSKMPYLGIKPGDWKIVPEDAYLFSFYLKHRNWAYFHWTGSTPAHWFSKSPFWGIRGLKTRSISCICTRN